MVKTRFATQFMQTAQYRNGAKNGAHIKIPHWKKGRVYEIGKGRPARYVRWPPDCAFAQLQPAFGKHLAAEGGVKPDG